MTIPLISIITVTYNAALFLEKTMQSVFNQSFRDFEYLIIDGASKDHTLDIIKKYTLKSENHDISLRWISEPDKGLYDAMNKGMNMALGKFLWFINAGDKIYDENTLQTIVNAYKNNPDSDVIYGQSLIIDIEDNPLGERHKIAPKNLTQKNLLNGLVVCHQSILVNKNIAPRYDLQYRICADYDWTCNVLAKSQKNLYIDKYISKFMTSGLSAIHRKKSWIERFYIMKNHFGLIRTILAHIKIILKYPFTTKYN